jgi:hypothetical protein
MKRSMRTMFVVLAIVLSFVAVQSVFADTTTITGTIVELNTQPNMIVVNDGNSDVKVYGVKSTYYNNECLITLNAGDYVRTQVYEEECLNGTVKLKACGELIVGDPTTATILLRPCK